jgi:hypothetical protein
MNENKKVTIKLELYPDDIEACRVASEWSDDIDMVSLCKHILEQVELAKETI